MTTFMREKRICFVCGHESLFQETTSTNSFGSPDLDLRPPEMKRSTMMTWVHQCPKCGYAAESIMNHTSVSRECLQSKEYKGCNGTHFKSALARQFYQSYMIKVLDRQLIEAFYALVHAAWSCDDSNEKENAVQCRKLALQYVDELIRFKPENRETYRKRQI